MNRYLEMGLNRFISGGSGKLFKRYREQRELFENRVERAACKSAKRKQRVERAQFVQALKTPLLRTRHSFEAHLSANVCGEF